MLTNEPELELIPIATTTFCTVVFNARIVKSKIDFLPRGEILEFVSIAVEAHKVFNANFSVALAIVCDRRVSFS